MFIYLSYPQTALVCHIWSLKPVIFARKLPTGFAIPGPFPCLPAWGQCYRKILSVLLSLPPESAFYDHFSLNYPIFMAILLHFGWRRFPNLKEKKKSWLKLKVETI